MTRNEMRELFAPGPKDDEWSRAAEERTEQMKTIELKLFSSQMRNSWKKTTETKANTDFDFDVYSFIDDDDDECVSTLKVQ